MNKELLEDFVKYCKKHPTDRFWQALRNWSGYNFVYVSGDSGPPIFDDRLRDTYYWENKSG